MNDYPSAAHPPEQQAEPFAYVGLGRIKDTGRVTPFFTSPGDPIGFPVYAHPPVLPWMDVRKILLDVVPGEDGMGLEVYAKSTVCVERKLTEMGERIEELESKLAAHPPAQPSQPEQRAPAGYLYQHDETGRTTFRDELDPNMGPRWYAIPLYAQPIK